MKSNKFTMALLAMLAISLTFTACKKDAASSTVTSSDSTQTQADDEALTNNSTDDATNDATTALEGSGGSFASRPDSAGNVPPGITPPTDGHVGFDTSAIHKAITVTYDGVNNGSACTRTGSIRITFDTSLHWKDAGATVTINFDSLRIRRTLDGKSVLLNGSITYTNVSGGLIRNLSGLDSIVHTISGTLTITFDNGTQRTWTISKRRVFTYNNGIVLTTTGNGAGGIAEQGTNRYGNPFSSVITIPRVIEQSCEFRLVSGQTVYTGQNRTVTTTFGLDAAGNPVSSCPIGVFYYEVSGTINGVSFTLIRPY
jgi:hypothetical protein